MDQVISFMYSRTLRSGRTSYIQPCLEHVNVCPIFRIFVWILTFILFVFLSCSFIYLFLWILLHRDIVKHTLLKIKFILVRGSFVGSQLFQALHTIPNLKFILVEELRKQYCFKHLNFANPKASIIPYIHHVMPSWMILVKTRFYIFQTCTDKAGGG